MKLPQIIPECDVPKQQFCRLCRDKEQGREFRSQILGVHGIKCGVDFECPKGKPWSHETPSTGLGDTIAKITKAVGIKPCGGCKKRQAALNKIAPYKSK